MNRRYNNGEIANIENDCINMQVRLLHFTLHVLDTVMRLGLNISFFWAFTTL